MARVLLGVTGSVAAIRTPALCGALAQAGHAVRIVITGPARYFFEPKELPPGVLYRDADEWPRREQGDIYQRDDPVLHIELRRWADLLLIAPLDANTLAKLALGLSDNCLTCVWRAWDPQRPVILAPAMNTFMWEHPLTRRHLCRLIEDHGDGPAPAGLDQEQLVGWLNGHCPRLRIVGPISKQLACGDIGVGGMSEVPEIVEGVKRVLAASD
jgi:phosphopantothenoylcysteine decarboxylase